MILPVMVVGSFETLEGKPLSGRIDFSPRDLWVEHDGQAMATLSASVDLIHGRFDVILTPGIWYEVKSPFAKWTVRITEPTPVQRLRDLLPSAFFEELKFRE